MNKRVFPYKKGKIYKAHREGEKSHITVDSDTPMRVGGEPLINITRNE